MSCSVRTHAHHVFQFTERTRDGGSGGSGGGGSGAGEWTRRGGAD